MIKQSVKEEAIKLRKEGFSIKEISKQLNLAQSTASLVVRGVVLSKKAQEILLDKRNLGRLKGTQVLIENRIIRQEKAINVAKNFLEKMSINDGVAFLIASISYECEGGKSNFGVLEFTNSDPLLVKLFLSTLRKSFVLDESKFRVAMHLHSYHKEEDEKVFWSKVTMIPTSNFIKSFQKKESGINRKEGYRGCVQIKYFDVSIKRTLLATKYILTHNMGL